MSRMAMTFANPPSLNPPSSEDLRNTFDAAIAQIDGGAGSSNRARTPIVVRRPTAILGEDAVEKRALTDAARALARLWNISPRLVR